MTTAVGTYATTAALKAMIGTTDDDDNAVLGLICDRVNAYIEFVTKRVLAPVSSATYLFDGNGSTHLFVPRGIRAVTELKIGDYTGDTRDTIASGDYFLRPLAHNRVPGWPALWIALSDMPTGDHRVFGEGRETVSVTATTGWAAIPDEITELALSIAHRAWNARQSGLQDAQGIDEQGRPVVARFLSGKDREILRGYTVHQPQVIG